MGEIFRAGMEVPQDIDGASASPKGYSEYLDANKRDPLSSVKGEIIKLYPGVSNIMVFQKSGVIGGDMKIRMIYKGNPVEFDLPYQKAIDTLTLERNDELTPFLQNLSPEARGIYNSIIGNIKKRELPKKVAENDIPDLDINFA